MLRPLNSELARPRELAMDLNNDKCLDRFGAKPSDPVGVLAQPLT